MAHCPQPNLRPPFSAIQVFTVPQHEWVVCNYCNPWLVPKTTTSKCPQMLLQPLPPTPFHFCPNKIFLSKGTVVFCSFCCFWKSNVTGRHRGPKRKLRTGVACAAFFCKSFAGTWRPWWVLLQHSITLRRVLFIVECGIARFLCAMRVFEVRASPSPLGYLCNRFRFFRGLHCGASPCRKIAYSITHSPSLVNAAGTEACASEHETHCSEYCLSVTLVS